MKSVKFELRSAFFIERELNFYSFFLKERSSVPVAYLQSPLGVMLEKNIIEVIRALDW